MMTEQGHDVLAALATAQPSGSIGSMSAGGSSSSSGTGEGASSTGTPDPGAGTGGGGGLGGGGSSFLPFMLLLVGMMVLMMVMGSRREKKERQKKEAMLGAMKKNDRVRTVGGVLGTVMEVKDDEVVVRVDDQTGTKMRFARSAIQEVAGTGVGAGTD